MTVLSPSPKLQFFTAAGEPLVGGKLYSYAAGTTTPLATYTNFGGLTANTNPVILDARGEANVWLTDVRYKLKLTDANDVEIWTVDNVYASNLTAQDITDAINAAKQDILDDFAASNGSSLVGFIQGGTSPVATTVQTKLRRIIDVRDYGATGDGVTDDTTALQNAFNATYDADAMAYIPAGNYLISGNLRIRRPFVQSTGVRIFAVKSSDQPPTVGVYFERRMLVANWIFEYVNVFANSQDGGDQLFTPLAFQNCAFGSGTLTLGQSDVLTAGYSVSECNFASRISRFGPAIALVNASNVTIDQNSFQEYQSAIDVSPSLSLSSTNLKISNNVILNSSAYGIELNGTSMNRISNISIENNSIAESIRDTGSSSRGAIYAEYCCNVYIKNNTITHRNNGVNLRATLGATIRDNVFNAAAGFPCIRVAGAKQVNILDNSLTMTAQTGTYGILVTTKLSAQPYTNQNILIQGNTLKGTTIGMKIEYVDNVQVLSNNLTAMSAISGTAGLLWFESTVTRGYYYDNRFYGPSGTAVVNAAGVNVTATPSAQTTVTTTVPATSVAAPIITNTDPDLNNAKSYVVTFTIGDATKLTQLIDDENKQTMTAWMTGVVGATLAWNSCAWNTTTGKVADVIQNGAVFDNFDTEEYWGNKSMGFVDRFNFFSCRMFYSATVDQDIPLGMAAAQLEEYAWNTATFRPPLVVDGVVFDAVGSGIVSSTTYNVQVSGRMCMGQKADGTYVILCVDGATDVNGCTEAQAASKMLSLGCENAFNLDGGGSATLWYSGSVINSPSDPGGERAIPAVMYV